MCGFIVCKIPSRKDKKSTHAIPPAVLTLKAANGSLMDILGFTRFDLQLGDVTRPVEALTIPSLRPEYTLLDNSAVFIWCKA